MRFLLLSMFLKNANSVSVKSSLFHSSPLNNSDQLLVVELQECQLFQSLSSNPPIFMVSCPDLVVSEDKGIDEGIDEVDGEEKSEKMPSFIGDLTVNSILSLETKIPLLKVKRGLPKEEPTGSLPNSNNGKKPECKGLDCSEEIALKQFNLNILQCYQNIKRLKEEVVQNLERSKDSLSTSKSELNQLILRCQNMEARGITIPAGAKTQMEDLKELLTMINLNFVMRFLGCEDQLNLIPSPDYAEKNVAPKTKLSLAVDKLEAFGVLMMGCFDEDGDPRIDDSNLRLDVDNVKSKFEILKTDLQELISQKTILSKIFEEDLLAIENQIHDLAESVRLKTVISNLPSKNLTGELSTNINQLDWTDDEKEMLIRIQGWNFQLASAYSSNPQENDNWKLTEFRIWRKNLHDVCHKIYSEVIEADFPESALKAKFEDLLKDFTQELIRKTNSIFLVAVTLSSVGMYQEDKSLEFFSELYENLESDILFVASNLAEVLSSLKIIQQGFERLKIPEIQSKIRVQKEILQRLSAYIDAVQWNNLPEAEECKKLKTESFGILKDIESRFNLGSMIERRNYPTSKEKQLPTSMPGAALAQVWHRKKKLRMH